MTSRKEIPPGEDDGLIGAKEDCRLVGDSSALSLSVCTTGIAPMLSVETDPAHSLNIPFKTDE